MATTKAVRYRIIQANSVLTLLPVSKNYKKIRKPSYWEATASPSTVQLSLSTATSRRLL